MAVLLKYGSLIPLAIRVTLSGGAAYGSVKHGIWTDSSKSPEKLQMMKQSVKREIEYPRTLMKYYKPGQSFVSTRTQAEPSIQSVASTMLTSAARGWNGVVMNMCEFLATVDGGTVQALGGRSWQWARQLGSK